MKYLLIFITCLSSFICHANDPSKPLIKKDTINYIQCYVIDPRDGGAYAPYTIFKIGKNYYEGVAFPYRNSDCIENYTSVRDSFNVNYELTIDSLGEGMVYSEAEQQGAGDRFDRLRLQDFPELVECLDKEKFLETAVLQFVQVRFIANYYLIRCDKPRNCSGPDVLCSNYIDIQRTPVFTKIEKILR